MGTVIVLGAGFSKGIGGLPVNREMIAAFRKVRAVEQRHGHGNRVAQADRILDFWRSVENEYLTKPASLAHPGDQLIESNYESNFEAMLSYIDLNSTTEIRARLSNSETGPYSLSGCPMFSHVDVRQIRMDVETYIYLVLEKHSNNDTLLSTFFKQYGKSVSSVVTFNYDTIIDEYLFRKRLWVPQNGYGIELDIAAISEAFRGQRSEVQFEVDPV